MDTQLLIAALVFIVPMCFTPGPNNILCAAHGSQYGFRNTLPLIMGMAIGWSTLGLFVGGATVFIEKNQSFFDALTVVGAIYIAYLGYKVWQSSPMSDDEKESTRLGIKTGTIIQVVNGKAWIHFLVLMTQFGTIFGTTFAAKAMLVFLNLVFGLPAVMSWAAFGTQLRKLFSTPKSARVLNRIMGSSLVAVAIWIVI
ncbi:LysE family translocator [Euryarchaeota archaeon]|jgi:threonine/homoserine/homoserine lactone efflux protein|nr:LysE family translocator [Euryarchaeota archaeon]MDB4865155.1 LysE family translocator [Euryarchaeota archaeon]MDC0327761.1 LysE family translocator [bacterium]|tara:strand:- start:339 stop:932 length:594 start_codon:yes stop_codon:yes gene_type:complete